MTDTDSKSNSSRKCYGKGLIDGLAMAGIPDPGDFVNRKKLQRIEEGITSLAKKVLDAVPMRDPWSRSRIMQELSRQGHRMDLNVAEGCLQSLKESGLIREPMSGNYIRVDTRLRLVERSSGVNKPNEKAPEEVVSPREIKPTQTDEPTKEEGGQELLDRIGEVGSKLREISKGVDLLARQIEDIAIEATTKLQKNTEDADNLRQLQALLKKLGI